MKKFKKLLRIVVLAMIPLIFLILLSIPLGAVDFGNNPLKLTPQKYAFTGVRIIDLNTDPYALLSDSTQVIDLSSFVSEPKTVLVDAGKIIAMLGKSESIDASFEKIDGEGMYLMAGLMDMHTHLFDRTDLLLYLANGVTTVRNMMGMSMHLRWREQVREGEYPGPTIYTGSPTLNAGKNTGPFHKVVKNPKKARKAVQKFADKGYDFIKIYDGITDELLLAIVDEAKQQGLRIAGHPPYEVGIDTIMQSGFVSLEHAEEILQALLNYTYNEKKTRVIARKMRENKVYFTSTLAAYKHIVEATIRREAYLERDSLYFINPLLRTIGKKQLKEWVEIEDNSNVLLKYDLMERIIRVFREEGVAMLLGTDTGPNLTLPGFTLHEEIDLEIAAGLTNYEVLYSGTVQAAKALGLQNAKGQVKTGMDADLILVRSNPLVDHKTLKSPVGVMKGGVWYDQESLATLVEEAKNHTSGFRTFGRLLGHLISK